MLWMSRKVRDIDLSERENLTKVSENTEKLLKTAGKDQKLDGHILSF